jgi:hypothetical protein
MAAAVYILCAVTSICCAVLLLRSSRKTPSRLLFWSGGAFIWLALGNVLLVIDLLVVPNYDLLIVRNVVTFFAVAMLLYGLIWETE